MVAYLTIPKLIRWSKKNRFVDIPDKRKMHKEPVPTLGGIAIFLGLTSTFFFWGWSMENLILLLSLIMLTSVGIWDDLKDLSPKIKFAFQILVALTIAMTGLRVHSLYGLFGIHEFSEIMQYVFTIVLVTGIINAFNLIDGIDGLAGGIGFINSVFFGVILYLGGEKEMALLAISFSGAILAFLRYNFNPAAIFMGDTRSMLIGLIMAVFGLKIINLDTTIINAGWETSQLMIIVFGIMLLPAYDTLRVFGTRIAKRKSPFKPDKTHIHHLFILTKLNHRNTSSILYVFNTSIILSSILLMNYPISFAIPLLVMKLFIMMEFLTFRKLLQNARNKKHTGYELHNIGLNNNLLLKRLGDENFN